MLLNIIQTKVILLLSSTPDQAMSEDSLVIKIGKGQLASSR